MAPFPPPRRSGLNGTDLTSPEELPFQSIVEPVTDYAISMLDETGCVLSWNQGAELIHGYRADEMSGQHIARLYPQAARDEGRPEHELQMAAAADHFEGRALRLRKDGSAFWASVVITALRNGAGTLLGFSQIIEDLSEQKRYEDALKESEERFRLLVDGVQDYGIFLLDAQGCITSWNAGAERIKGYSAQEILGQHFSVFYPLEALSRGWPQLELKAATEKGRFEDEGWRIRKDGSRFWANVIITAMRGPDGGLRGFSKITRDLTERKRYEDTLRDSEERFRVLVEGVRDYAIYRLDTEGSVASWSSGAERIMGYRAEEITGKSFARFYPPEDVAAGRPAMELRQAALNGRTEDRGWRVRKDGERFWAHAIITALYDSAGELRGFAMVTRDLTDQKRVETLEQEGRNVTEFLAMLAHELRSPLAPIRNAATVLRLSSTKPRQVEHCQHIIERQMDHLSRLVDDLLDVSRITSGKIKIHAAPMDLQAAIARAVENAKPLIDTREHRFRSNVPEQPIRVNGDKTRLIQVVVNVLSNAAKYTPNGGEITLDAAAEGDFAVIRVRDTGTGLSREMQDRVFDLFFQGERSLARAEGGLGIGLALARRIVLMHGGSIAVASEGLGRGAEFTIRLPLLRAEQTYASVRRTGITPERTGEKRTILVVDDNADSAESLALLLRMHGHEVAVEHDGPGALQYIIAREPQIVLLDIGLPGMSGYEVAKRVRALPEGQKTRLYAMTGYGQPEHRRRAFESGFDGHLVKPVPPEELIRMVVPENGENGNGNGDGK